MVAAIEENHAFETGDGKKLPSAAGWLEDLFHRAVRELGVRGKARRQPRDSFFQEIQTMQRRPGMRFRRIVSFEQIHSAALVEIPVIETNAFFTVSFVG